MSRLDEIEARLAAATPGPWEAVTDEHKHTKEYSVWADSRSDYVAEWVATRTDADLLAHTPDDLAALVTFAREVQKLHRREDHRDSHGKPYAVCSRCLDTLAEPVDWPCPTAALVQQIGGAS